MELKNLTKFDLSRAEDYLRNGKKQTKWLKIGSLTLIQTKNGEPRLMVTINHIPGTIIGFLSQEKMPTDKDYQGFPADEDYPYED